MPLFALTIMFSFTFSPKAARRTRKAACSRGSSSSSPARRTDSASPRERTSPASALSARDSQSGTCFLLRQQRDEPPVDRARQRAPRLVDDEHVGELLDQLGVRGRELVVAV